MPLAWAKPTAAGVPESGTGMTTSASTGGLGGQPPAHLDPGLVQPAAVEGGVRPGEVDVLEDAQRLAARRHGLAEVGAVLVEHDQLARGELALDGRADDVQRARLGCEHPGVVDAADHQRADAVGIAEPGDRVLGEDDGGEGALDLLHGVGDGGAQVARRVVRDQRRDHLGVRGRVQPHPLLAQLVAEGGRVGQVAVVGRARSSGLRRAARSAGRCATRSSRWSSSARGRSPSGRAAPTASARRTPG